MNEDSSGALVAFTESAVHDLQSLTGTECQEIARLCEGLAEGKWNAYKLEHVSTLGEVERPIFRVKLGGLRVVLESQSYREWLIVGITSFATSDVVFKPRALAYLQSQLLGYDARFDVVSRPEHSTTTLVTLDALFTSDRAPAIAVVVQTEKELVPESLLHLTRCQSVVGQQAVGILLVPAQFQEPITVIGPRQAVVRFCPDREELDLDSVAGLIPLSLRYTVDDFDASPRRKLAALQEISSSDQLMQWIAQLLCDVGGSEVADGRATEGLRKLNQVVAAVTQGALDYQLARALLYKGRALRSLDQPTKAIDALEQLLKLSESKHDDESQLLSAEALLEIGHVYRGSGLLDKAIDTYNAVFNRYLGAGTDDLRGIAATGLLQQGVCLMRLGQFSQASRAFVKVAEIFGGTPNAVLKRCATKARLHRGLLYAIAGMHQEAILNYETIINEYNQDPDVELQTLYVRAVIYAALEYVATGYYQKACQYCGRVEEHLRDSVVAPLQDLATWAKEVEGRAFRLLLTVGSQVRL